MKQKALLEWGTSYFQKAPTKNIVNKPLKKLHSGLDSGAAIGSKNLATFPNAGIEEARYWKGVCGGSVKLDGLSISQGI